MSYKKFCDICEKNIDSDRKSYQITRKALFAGDREFDICSECFETIRTAMKQKQLPKGGETDED